MYLLPGFVDTHGHGAELSKAPDLSYAYKLWLAHGVTTVRGVPLADVATTLSEKRRSEKNEIVAPRIFAYGRIGEGWNKDVSTRQRRPASSCAGPPLRGSTASSFSIAAMRRPRSIELPWTKLAS